MRNSMITKLALIVLSASGLAACDSPNYVYNNGTKYYDANDVSTDTLPSGAYTKNGQYVGNPDDATNTRDNRGNRPTGYGHNISDDYHAPATTTVVYPDGTAPVPGGQLNAPDTYYPATTSTTVIQTR